MTTQKSSETSVFARYGRRLYHGAIKLDIKLEIKLEKEMICFF